MITLWHNRNSGTARCVNTKRPLTHSLDLGEEGLAMQATRTCSVDGCNKRRHAKGFCATHYMRWKAHGEATVTTRPYGRTNCQVPDCERQHYNNGYCGRHNRRFRLYGDPLHNEPMGPKSPLVGPANPAWKNGDITYFTAHQRVTKKRGPASVHACVDCGCAAEQWSYTHDCPDELRDERGYMYSADPARYSPRCIPCHAVFDTARRRGGESDAPRL